MWKKKFNNHKGRNYHYSLRNKLKKEKKISSEVEVAFWWADALADDTQHSSTVNFTCDHICTLTFDFDTATRWMTKKTTSFNATAITEHDWLFVTVRKTTSGDGSSFNIHSTLTWDGA